MNPVNHSAMVTLLVKPGADIIESLTPGKMDMLHMAVGISGEAGELLDCLLYTSDAADD